MFMKIQNNFSLKNQNTFGIDAMAQKWVEISHLDELEYIYKNRPFQLEKKLILGGGSNILFTDDFKGLIIKIGIKGIEISKETPNHIYLKAGAGVVWHNLVAYAVANNWGGIENLSLIPGTVGAAPLQNIGAYGVELKDTFFELEAYNILSHEVHVFNNEECKFGYRESIFKNEAKGNYVILNVTLKLSKKPKFNVEYGAIKDTLAAHGVKDVTVKAISDAVIEIRQSKLPNPTEIGNAGSFFKNPEITEREFEILKQKHPELPSYPAPNNLVKIPAGWLIERSGWKGYRDGDIGVHAKQALVLVNYGTGTGAQIKKLSEKIQASVYEQFGVKLTAEVNFI